MSTKPEEKDYTLFVSGSIYERQKKYDQAAAAYQKAVELNPPAAAMADMLQRLALRQGVWHSTA
jgi:tetratricopeptide (TPR) repeat protein